MVPQAEPMIHESSVEQVYEDEVNLPSPNQGPIAMDVAPEVPQNPTEIILSETVQALTEKR